MRMVKGTIVFDSTSYDEVTRAKRTIRSVFGLNDIDVDAVELSVRTTQIDFDGYSASREDDEVESALRSLPHVKSGEIRFQAGDEFWRWICVDRVWIRQKGRIVYSDGVG